MLIWNKHHRQTGGQTETNTHRVASLLINYMEITLITFRDKTMADKFMHIQNDATQNYPFYRLKLVVETFEHST